MKCRQFGSNVAFVHFFFQKCTMLHLIRGWRHFILDHRILCRPKTTFGPRVGSIVALTQCCLCDIGPGDAFPMVSSDELTGQRTHSVECRSNWMCERVVCMCVRSVCTHVTSHFPYSDLLPKSDHYPILDPLIWEYGNSSLFSAWALVTIKPTNCFLPLVDAYRLSNTFLSFTVWNKTTKNYH